MRTDIAFVMAAVAAVSLPAASDPHARVHRDNPVALSPDGQWLFSANTRQQLLRQSVKDPTRIERVGLPKPVSAIAASHSGKRVAVALANGELAVVSFALRNATGGAVLWRIVPGDSHSRDERTPTCFGDSLRLDRSQQGRPAPAPKRAVAISGDGRLVAFTGNPIAVHDGDSGALVQCIPAGDNGDSDIRFVDHGARLLVAQASGKGESMYSTWDVRKGELLNLHTIRGIETPELRNVDQWGTAIFPDSETGQEQSSKPWKRIDLRACGSTAAPRSSHDRVDDLPYLDLLADPRARWIAQVAPTGHADKELARTRITFLDTSAGNILSEAESDADDLLILSNWNGSKLLGIAVPSTRRPAASGFRIGDGPLRAFPLHSPPTTSEAADESTTWPSSPCLIEDETAHARSVNAAARRAIRQFIVPIDNASSWQQRPGGPLWVDTGEIIEQHDPRTGRLLNSIVKPTSAAISATPWYAREEFLLWQGDTVTRRPFADPTDPKRRIVVARRPGWVALDVRPVGEHVEVLWATPACARKKLCNEGDESTAYYDERGAEMPKTIADSPRQAGGEYTWSRSYFGSIRARRHEPGKADKTVMWIGLRASQWVDPSGSPEEADDSAESERFASRHSLLPWQSANLLPLDGQIGVLFNRSGVWIYDVEARALLARIAQEHTTNAVWNPDTRIIVVESHDTVSDIHLLRGYLIEGASLSAASQSGEQKP